MGHSTDKLGFIYAEFWQRLMERCTREDVSLLCDVAGVLVTAHAPLTADQVCGVLGLRVGGWDFALRHLAEYLTVVEKDEDGGRVTFYRIYPESFADFLRAKVAVDRKGFCNRLAAYCLRWAQLPEGHGRTYALRFGPRHLLEAGREEEVAGLLLDLFFLEARTEAGMVFELAADFTAAATRLKKEDHRRRFLELIEEAIRKDIHFIARHPTTLFECLWNSCWWYDCPEVAEHYDPPALGWPPGGPPWARSEPKLADLMESWRQGKEANTPGFSWIRSLRPPTFPLGGPQRVVVRFDTDRVRIVDLHFCRGDMFVIAWFNPVGAADLTNKTLSVWESATGREVRTIREDEFPFQNATLSPDGRWHLLFGGEDGGWGKPVRLHDSLTGLETASFATHKDVNISCVAFSPVGRRIVAGGYGMECEGHLMLWDVASRERIAWKGEHASWLESIFAVAFSLDGQQVVSGTSDGAVQLWEAQTGKPLGDLCVHEEAVTAVAFSVDGQRILSASHDGTIRISETGRVLPAGTLKGHPDGVAEVVFSTDGRRLVTRSENQTVWLWSAVDGVPVACLHRSSYVVFSGGGARHSLFADGQHVVHLSTEGIKVWDAVHGAEIGCVASPVYFWSSHVVFSPDGQRCLVFGGAEKTAEIIVVAGGACLARLAGHEGEITCMAFSPDGQRIASGSEDGAIRLWDGFNGTALARMRGHDGLVTSVAFSPDGQRIASASVDKTVRTWDSAGGTELACLRIDDPGVWNSGWSEERGEDVIYGVSAVAFTADGQHLVTLSRFRTPFLSETHTSRVWDEHSGVCLKTLQGMESFPAVCAGSRFQAVIRGPEVEITSAETGQVVGWFPAALKSLTAHPFGRIWAGKSGKHLYHFALEGSETEDRCSMYSGDGRGAKGTCRPQELGEP
jgi:WD40 repeat protein